MSRATASPVTGLRVLLPASLKQDRVNIAPWVVLISILSATSIVAYRWIIDTPAERRQIATSLGLNPALGLVFGQAHDMMTPEGFNAWRALALGSMFAGLMAIMVVVRNSRAQEDSGQAELLASGVMGRQTRLAVALVMATIAAIALGIVSTLLTLAFGATLRPTVLQSAGYTCAALVFAGIAAICCQVGAEARTASSMAVAVLGVCYALRGYVDSNPDLPGWTRWATPFGWITETQPATVNRWWPLAIALGFAALCVAVAFALEGRRDFGQGCVATRPGPARGGHRFGVWALAWQLNKGSITGWLLGLAALGTMFGNLVGPMGDMVAENPALAQVLAQGAIRPEELRSSFVATILQIIAIVTSIMGVGMVQRIHTEEQDYRVEPLLAGSLRRQTYLASTVVPALLATAVGLMVAGTALGLVASRTTVGIEWWDVVLQAAATVPAVWVLVALSTALVGAVPRRRVVGWIAVVATFAITLLGPTLHLWEWAMRISPLRHVPNILAAEPDWAGLGWLALVTCLFLAVGFAGFRRRDVI